MSLSDPDRIEITAHRGDPGRAPENTLASLRAGLQEGADAVEWDVRICRTGEPVVIHDETVDRTTDGSGRVEDLPFDALRELDAGAWFSEAHAGARIPTLDEAVELVAGWEAGAPGAPPVGIYCEVKAIREEGDAGVVLDAFRRRGLLGRTAFISLYPDILAAFRRRDPEAWLGWVVAREQEMGPAAAWVRSDPCGVLAPAAGLLLGEPGRARALLAEGIPIGTWTVDDLDEADALADLGVRRITTNRVRELVEWARSIRPPE